jgi:hypothetical protein
LGNLGVWCAIAVLGILMGKEFLDWVWWYIWGDDEDEPNPGPLICKTWAVWELIGRVRFWLWLKIWRLPERWIDGIWYRLFPPESPKEPTDRDGRTPTEWLSIGIFGVWDVHKDEYDQKVKTNWEEYLRTRNVTEVPEAEHTLKHE